MQPPFLELQQSGPSTCSTSTEKDTSPTVSSLSLTHRKRHKQQARQLQACSKCRERKVKCDKTLPCSACCARGHPKECVFAHGEGSDHGPIAQSHELRRLRAENQRLKERLQSRSRTSGDSGDDESLAGPPPGSLPFAPRRLGVDEPLDTIYFGTPGFASVTADLSSAATNSASNNLLHRTISAHEQFTQDERRTYPFPTIWTTSTWISGLYSCLQPWEETSELLLSFASRNEAAWFLRGTVTLTRADVENFIADFENNATAYPDVLALMFAVLATEAKKQDYDAAGKGASEPPSASNDLRRTLFVSAAMQALRHSACMSRPTLPAIQAIMLMCLYLLDDSRALDAWTILGTAIRAAQGVGLHRNPHALRPIPSQRDADTRKRIWWHLLDMDQQLSLALGRPLGISSIGDCPMPDASTSDTSLVRLLGCVDQLTILGRQIMGTAPLISHRISHFSDKLQTLLDTIPDAVQFRRSWLANLSSVPEQPLDVYSASLHLHVHSVLVLLHRQRLDSVSQTPQSLQPPEYPHEPRASQGGSLDDEAQQKIWLAMVESSIQVINAFEYFNTHHLVLVDWIMKQRALSAAVVLLESRSTRPDERHSAATQTVLRIFQHHAQSMGDSLSNSISKHLMFRLGQQSDQYGIQMSTLDRNNASHESRRDSQISWSSGGRSTSTVLTDPSNYYDASRRTSINNTSQQVQWTPLSVLSQDATHIRRATVSGPSSSPMTTALQRRESTGFCTPATLHQPQPRIASFRSPWQPRQMAQPSSMAHDIHALHSQQGEVSPTDVHMLEMSHMAPQHGMQPQGSNQTTGFYNVAQFTIHSQANTSPHALYEASDKRMPAVATSFPPSTMLMPQHWPGSSSA